MPYEINGPGNLNDYFPWKEQID